MSETGIAVEKRSLAKGLVAGLIGGLVATAAKTFAERMFPPRGHGEPEPPVAMAETATVAKEIDWGFGATIGAAYGVMAEFYPAATAKDGASFGLALGTLTHEGALPALGLSEEPEEQTLRERASEMSSHVVYGVVAEFVRRWVRKVL